MTKHLSPSPCVTEKARAGAFISFFDRTPPGIFCPHFHVLAHGNGCPFACDYCFLLGTFRKLIDFQRPTLFTNYSQMQRETERFLQRNEPCTLNIGELSDSLAYDAYTGISQWIVPMFGRQEKHKLIMLTKSADVDQLVPLRHNGRTVVSFSVNAPEVAGQFEKKAPAPAKRLAAAKKVAAAGYPVRLRIDPMIPIANWHDQYAQLVEMIADAGVFVERLTLGTLRFYPATKAFAGFWGRDTSVFDYGSCVDGSDNRRRVPHALRMEMYCRTIELLWDAFPNVPVGLCKETVALRDELGFGDRDSQCNCTL